jgi:anti-sigma regulatory factor (Ser/Thr protein kinase)
VRLAEGWAEMTVVDRGHQQRPEPAWREDEVDDEDAVTAISGRGLWLMGRLVDEVRLEQVKPGTRVTLRRRLSDPARRTA